MRTHSKNFKRVTMLGLIAMAAGILSVMLAASHASSASALPSPLAGAEAQLSSVDDIHMTPLPAGTKLAISQSAAETTALKEFELPPTSDVSAYAVSDTDNAQGMPQSDGTLKPTISNRPVWVVLIPHQTVRANVGPGKDPGPPLTATLAVFVDGNSGEFLMASTFYP